MSVGRISFWQQNQNYWSRSASSGQSVALRNVVITSMFGASTNLSRGLASIANQTALNRVNSQLTAAVQNALASIGGGSTSAGGSTASSSSSGATASPSSSSANSSAASSGARAAAPATGTGTAPLTAGTSLATLGILKNGTITVSDGTKTTIYKSTGSDTVSDLVSALNRNVYGNAQVAAWLNASGKLVISGKNNTAMITVGGTNAANVGFGTGHAFFQPTTPSPSTAGSSNSQSSSSSAGSTSSASTSANSASSGSVASHPRNAALGLQTTGTAEIFLASNGLSGNLVNLLA
jgi:hypothetical protein